MNNNHNERRKFYRVNESASIELYPISDDSLFPFKNFKESPTLQNLNELKQTDIEVRQILGQITEKDRLLGVYLKALNKKIDTLTHIVATSSVLLDEKKVYSVSMSEGGFSFSSPQNYPVGQLLAVKIIIVDDLTALICKANVVECIPLSNEKFDLHCEYEDLDDSKRMLLARHIIRKQIKDRQHKTDNTP